MKKMISVRILLPFVFCSIMVGCFSTQPAPIYFPANQGYHLTAHKRIAVITGTNDDVDITLANKMMERLVKSGAFIVVSQEELSKKIPKYPLNFHLIDRNDINIIDKSETYLPEDVQKKAELIAAKLRVDYLLIVWSINEMSCTVRDYVVVRLPVATRMIEYPSKDIVGYSRIQYSNARLAFPISEPSEEQIDDLYNITSTGITNEILRNANIEVKIEEKKGDRKPW